MSMKEVAAIESLIAQTLKPALTKLGKSGIDVREVSYQIGHPDPEYVASPFIQVHDDE